MNPGETTNEANACLIVKEEMKDGQVQLANGKSIPVISALCGEIMADTKDLVNRVTAQMPVVEGYIGNTKVSILRDTGCSGVIVRRGLVTEEQLTGENQLCVLIDGTVRKNP